MILITRIALSLAQMLTVAGLAYYYFLLVASLPHSKTDRPAKPSRPIFAIAIPAHNEETVLGQTLDTLRGLDYPRDRVDVYVVADYCDDGTAQVAREHGAICLERNQGPRGRKAFALRWLLQRILDAPRRYDAVVVFDADSGVHPAFLNKMQAALQSGASALQGQHVIANPGDSLFSRLAAVDMRLNNLLRNRAKHNLGWSCRLMGDAMCFSTDLIRAHGWGGESLAEDREFEMYLLLQGEKARYVAEAVSYGQASARWTDASKQRVRWYGGVVQLRRQYAVRLLMQGLGRGDWAVLDRAIELILPPFSSLSALALGASLAQAMWPAARPVLSLPWMLGVMCACLAFPFAALAVDRAPAWAFGAMLSAPVYLPWRLWQGASATLRRGQVEWVRTRRREEQPRHA